MVPEQVDLRDQQEEQADKEHPVLLARPEPRAMQDLPEVQAPREEQEQADPREEQEVRELKG